MNEEQDNENKILITKGETVNVGGVKCRVLNLTAKSITVRPETIMLVNVKGVAARLRKILRNGDLVLSVLAPEELERLIAKRTG